VRDVECGKQLNALTIAVATGFHSEEELLSKKPDYLFENLENYWKVLKIIEGLPNHSMAPKLSSQYRENRRNGGGNL
jgi:hypothetical protein